MEAVVVAIFLTMCGALFVIGIVSLSDSPSTQEEKAVGDFIFKTKKKLLEESLGCEVSAVGLSDVRQLENDVVYRFEHKDGLLKNVRMGVVKVTSKGFFVVKTSGFKRDVIYGIKDLTKDYADGDYICDGFYKCMGSCIGKQATFRVLERVVPCGDLADVTIADLFTTVNVKKNQDVQT